MHIRFVRTILLALLVLAVHSPAWAADKGDYATTPADNNGKKWRVGYLEGGMYRDYETITKMTIKGLAKLGWLEIPPFPDYDPDHKRFWDWVCDNAKSDYVEFVKDAFYSSAFDKFKREKTKEALYKRLNTKKDIDLMLAMGTWAGLDMATDKVSVPTVVGSSSDPIKSGIVKSADDSGYDHLHAKVEPDRYKRQVQLFHEVVGFKKLGIVYEDSVEGRTFGGLDSVEEVAADRGFEIVRCFARNNNVTEEQAALEVQDCYNKLAPQVGGIYVTAHRGENLKRLPNLLEPLKAAKTASFAMLGSDYVRHGVMLSIAQAGFAYVGDFHAEIIAKIFNGAKPRDLDQKWLAPPKIAINLRMAEIIGYDPPFDILAASDEIYTEIEPVQK